jgi:glycosyltransferase involved in cell wall biosynthesis
MERSIHHNILFVIPSLEMGGAQANMLRVANELYRTGSQATILDIKPSKRDIDFIDGLLDPAIPVYSPPFFLRDNRKASKLEPKKGLFHRAVLKFLPVKIWLKLLLKRKGIKLIHSHMYLADAFLSKNLSSGTTVISKQCGCYNMISSNIEDAKAKHDWQNKVNRIFQSIDGIVTLTDHHNAVLTELGITKPQRRVYNGVVLPILSDDGNRTSKASPLKLVMCARDEPSKGWKIALDAVGQLLHEGYNIKFDLLGSGPYLDGLRAAYAQHPSIRFLGAHPKPMEVHVNYDVGLLPTTFKAESLPNTVIEYQACGLATIATRVGEIPNLLIQENVKAGQLIEIGREVDMQYSLSNAIRQYLEDSTLLHEHKQNALALRNRFDIRQTAMQYLEFSNSIAAESKS